MHPLLRELLDLGFPEGDYALFGSGPLLVRRWIDEVGDLDVIARGAAWDQARRLGEPTRDDEVDFEIVAIGESITVGPKWGIGEVSVDDLIDEAEIVDGIPCARLEHVIAYKRLADRPKDRDHLAIIKAHHPRRLG